MILYYYHSNKDTEADKTALVVRNSCCYHLRSCTGSLCEYSMMGDIANGVSGFVKSHTITSPAPIHYSGVLYTMKTRIRENITA